MVNRTRRSIKGDQGLTNAKSTPASTSSEPQALDPLYGIYWQHRSQLIQEQSSSQTELDRSILNLSMSAIGASVAVITALHAVDLRIINLGFVFDSWKAFGIAIIATTESFNTSVHDYAVCIDQAYADIFGSSPTTSKRELNIIDKFVDFCRHLLPTGRLNFLAR